MKLDHSSVASLLTDLDRGPGRVFRFKFKYRGEPSTPWRLESATVVGESGIVVRIEYAGGRWRGVRDEFPLRLSDGWLTPDSSGFSSLATYFGTLSMTVVPAEGGPPCGGPSVDGFQRDRLDENLRRVFS